MFKINNQYQVILDVIDNNIPYFETDPPQELTFNICQEHDYQLSNVIDKDGDQVYTTMEVKQVSTF
jgi:hypothetical protein